MADPISLVAAQLAQYIDPSSSGGAWSTQSGRSSGAGFGPEGFLKKMAENFINQTGLTDLNKLGYGKITTPENAPVVRQEIYDSNYEVTGYRWATPNADFATDENGFLASSGYRALSPEEIKTIKDVGNGRYTADVVVGREGYYNKDTGAPVKFNGTLGGYGEGPGWTNTSLTFEGNRPVVKTTGEDSSDLGTILPIISIALLAIPGIGQAIGSAILPTGVSAATATAVGNAVVNAGLQVAAGAPVEQALTNAAASLGVSQLVPNLSGNSFVDNAVRSVATATLTGGDVEKALANSLIATGGNEVLGNVSFTGNATVDSGIASAITSGVMAAATGGDVGQSIARGFAAGTSGQITKEERMAESARSGAGFVGEDVTENMAESARSGAGFIGEDVTEPITLTGGASTGSTAVVTQAPDAALQAEAQKILRMAVRRETPDLRYDVNKDGRVTAADAFLVSSGRATIPTAEEYAASQITSPQDQVDTGSTLNVADVIGIDPRILAQGVTGGQFGDGGLLQTGMDTVSGLAGQDTISGGQAGEGKIFGVYSLTPNQTASAPRLVYDKETNQPYAEAISITDVDSDGNVVGFTVLRDLQTGEIRYNTLSEGDNQIVIRSSKNAPTTDYVTDQSGNIVRDSQGNPILTAEGAAVEAGEQEEAKTDTVTAGQPQLSQIDQDVLEQIQRDQGLVSEPPQITAQAPMPVAQDVTQAVNDGGEEQVYIPPPATRTTTPTVTPTLPEPIFRSAVAPRPALDLTDPSSEYFGERTYGDVTPPAPPAPPAPLTPPAPPSPVVDSAQGPAGESVVVVVAVDPVNNEALVIDASGNTSVVPATNSATGNPVNTGEAVTLTPDNSLTTGQATVAGGTVTDVVSGTPVDTGVVDTGVVDTTQVATGGGVPSTGPAVVDTTGGGLPSTDVGGVVGGEPGGAVDVGEVGGQTGGDIGGLPGGDPGGVLGGDPGGIDAGLPTDTSGVGDTGGEVVEKPSVLPPEEIYDSGDITDDEILQLITDDLAGGVEADRGVEEEGDGGLPTEDTQLTVTPRVVSKPPVRVPAGQRVQDTSDILPTRVALSEGSGDDVYGTPEEEQDPVWNIRSLKLRRALRI